MKAVYSDNFSAMGTRFGFVIPDCDHDKGEKLSLLIKVEVNNLEEKLSRFIPSSQISYLNKYAGSSPVEVDDDMWNVLNDCKKYYEITSGAFNIALSGLNDFWNDKQDIDNPENINHAKIILEKCSMNNLVLDQVRHSVFFTNPLIKLDLGAIGKGIAIKKAGEILSRSKIRNGFVSFGESSIFALGKHPNGPCWEVTIPNLFNENEIAYSAKLNNNSLSVSGNTSNNSRSGKTHIINAFTGVPVKEFKTALVIHECPVTAEALSTAFMQLDENQISETINKFKNIRTAIIKYNADRQPIIKEFIN